MKKNKRSNPRREETPIEMGKRLEAITAWQYALDDGPQFEGVVDLYAPRVEAIALKCCGYDALNLMLRLAKAGHRAGIRDVIRLACEMGDAIEEIARLHPSEVQSLAASRADWPVMICRHETSNKIVSTYLDDIGLGTQCVLNAGGQGVPKYSLRTPINRFVWRKLKGLQCSIDLMSDLPAIAAIDLKSLPKLTKATARTWANKALMPYITAMYGDFSKVPEFQAIVRRPGTRTRGQQRREIRKDVIRALQSLAPMA